MTLGLDVFKILAEVSEFSYFDLAALRKPGQCGQCIEQLPKQETGRPRRYCSSACKQKAYRRRRAAEVSYTASTSCT